MLWSVVEKIVSSVTRESQQNDWWHDGCQALIPIDGGYPDEARVVDIQSS